MTVDFCPLAASGQLGVTVKKSRVLRQAIMERRAVVVPGCHDALSASVIARSGFEAVQVSGFGLAGSYLSGPDVGLLSQKEVLDITRNIVKAVEVPVMADIDTGGGNAINAAMATESLIEMGAAGLNIEDQVFPKRCGHMPGKEVIPTEEMVGKIRACVDVRERFDPDFVLNARTDAFATHGLPEAVARANHYLNAGADLAFIDGIGTREDIAAAVREVGGPLSVNLMDGVTGVKTELIPVPELAAMGVARVSIPVASILVIHKALSEFFAALRGAPAGILPEAREQLSSFAAYNHFVGLDRYRALEEEFLPENQLERKYRG